MEKKVIIDFLNTHWDEFISLLSDMSSDITGRNCHVRIPYQVYEFAGLLSKIAGIYQDLHSGTEKRDTETFDVYHTNGGGLLKKAKYFRTHGLFKDMQQPRSIIVENGLFMVQPQQNRDKLNTAFKKLVDSVL